MIKSTVQETKYSNNDDNGNGDNIDTNGNDGNDNDTMTTMTTMITMTTTAILLQVCKNFALQSSPMFENTI